MPKKMRDFLGSELGVALSVNEPRVRHVMNYFGSDKRYAIAYTMIRKGRGGCR
ncbi:hypothetical protein [Candidatus Reidiella endopervernicosa]|uniref:Uncharacterized protein n=1 Tax=Candidatus Reidiella endopervernicosa TaxID=2738883 RepID=A0A6N0HZU0_9GAMM|nr:hypothetical protein [Candidatus Reidiella endopervernicosa]QKQ27878.1 hypothetical protein HUE57_17535 [Candidatus Reidiella endopervernicosa]